MSKKKKRERGELACKLTTLPSKRTKKVVRETCEPYINKGWLTTI